MLQVGHPACQHDLSGNGLNLCFGQHTGYGLNQETLKEGELKTWIRLESDEIVGDVTLNATYNQDLYTATPNDRTYV